ncbi:flagellar hook protein FlgE [Modestobacter excelsi]|uniref:flagellar hook protein FlgE n=1 Tax=Modestobacter excelsi TaxID=2213161 RepID=UPI00110D12EA|nr:flagellar hook protein FlgE [Modestobacter excelsi]
MLRSMFSAISGLKAHQTKLDTVGNNIANVNTVGYKSSQTVFQDTLSQVLSNGSAPTETTGGTNPAQVGLGVKVAGITTNFSQGSTQSTSRSTDFMISGDGFFVTQSGNEQLFTRAGSFDFDGQGRLVTSDGSILQGWTATDGVVDTNGSIGDLSVPYGQVMPPSASTKGGFTGNLTSGAAPNDAVESQITMYDALGNAHQVTATFTKTATPNAWSLTLKDENGADLTPDSDAGTAGVQAPVLNFDAGTGQIAAADRTLTFRPSAATAASWPQPAGGGLTLDLSTISQFGAKSSLKPTTTDGYAMGTLQSFSLSSDGTIVGVYSNSLRQDIGKLALATFSNPGGLEKSGNSSYRVGNNSGVAVIGAAGTGGAGTLTAGALEMSNVDLASEFTDLIIAQRGFQANSRVITTSDEVLQSLVQLGR